MDIDYKMMPDEDLKKLLSDMASLAQRLMDEISSLEKQSYRETMGKREQVTAAYAKLKDQLKNIYHYTQLGRNQIDQHNFYTAFFAPAIRDAYLSCHAKTNEKNLRKISSSLWELWSELSYHTPDK